MRLSRSFSVDSTGHNTGDFNCRSWLGVPYFLNTIETNILAKESVQAPSKFEAVTWAKYCCEALNNVPASSLALPLMREAVHDIDVGHVLKEEHLKNPNPAKQCCSGVRASMLLMLSIIHW